MHQPVVPDVIPSAATVNVNAVCAGCPTSPVCPVTDDILVNTTTVYSFCLPSPSGQGTAQLNANSCLIWTPSSSQTDIVTTCIVVCTGKLCDSTLITIYPPLPIDTVPAGIKCNSDTVYFENYILPLLSASCAYTGCHNAATAAEGVKLDNYANIIKTGKIKAFNPGGSELYKVIVTTNSKDVMPPPPAARLTTEQISMISKWISQGAKNNKCTENAGECKTQNVSYSTYLKPTLASCTSCHKTGNAGGGINLDSYQGMKAAALSGRLYGSLNWSQGYQAMPQGGSKLSDCTIKKVKSWIDAGAQDN